MVDIVEGLPHGKALDLLHAAPLMGYDSNVTGTNDYADIADSDIVVITAGIPRKPGMSRDDLLTTNIKITRQVCDNIVEYAPDSMIMTVTNPLDIITYSVLRSTQFDRNRVFGMSGLLDSSRFATFIAKEMNCSVMDVRAIVMGGHGDSMVPLPEYSSIAGIPLDKLMDDERIQKVVNRTIHAGAEIVKYMKTGSAFYAPSAAIVAMIEAILKDTRRIIPASVFLNGEYGIRDVCLGVPTVFGKGGAEDIIELSLTEQQQESLQNSARKVKEGIEKTQL
jgi:malate dehydrogenase